VAPDRPHAKHPITQFLTTDRVKSLKTQSTNAKQWSASSFLHLLPDLRPHVIKSMQWKMFII